MSLNPQQKQILDDFQTDNTRLAEEQFAQILTERSDVRLFFINENRCFTDGRNIILDPSYRELFTDKKAFVNTERFLSLDNTISSDPFLTLQMITRATNIHESLHILYTDFPPGFISDIRSINEICRLVLSQISNIIEDSFIEAAGCSLYDNLEHFLVWNRLADYFSIIDMPDTLEQRFSDCGIKIETKSAYENVDQKENYISETSEIENPDNIKFAKLIVYLNYMACLVLYPFHAMKDPPVPIAEYVEKTKKLFFEAIRCGSPPLRSDFCLQIFDIIEPLIPDSNKMKLPEPLQYLLDDLKTHENYYSSLESNKNNGREVKITRTLFSDTGDSYSFSKQNNKINNEIKIFDEMKKQFDNLNSQKSLFYHYNSGDFDCSNLHKNIKLKVKKPKINMNLKRAYLNMVSRYRLSISSYSSQIEQYLKINVEETEDKQLFGNTLNAKMFADKKRRFWRRKMIKPGVPDIGFLFMVDGSGSMEGELRNAVLASMVILHEVLRNNNIQHSIIEHRALYEETLLIHNILVDFNYKAEEKYNILSIDADEGTREGFSLYWAEKHIKENCPTEHKVIVMISDGAPAHTCDGLIDYVPPLSIKDTAETAKKIIKRGTSIIAIALDNDEEENCYEQLKMIYPSVVSCTDVSRLTGQLLNVVSKLFKGKM